MRGFVRVKEKRLGDTIGRYSLREVQVPRRIISRELILGTSRKNARGHDNYNYVSHFNLLF